MREHGNGSFAESRPIFQGKTKGAGKRCDRVSTTIFGLKSIFSDFAETWFGDVPRVPRLAETRIFEKFEKMKIFTFLTFLVKITTFAQTPRNQCPIILRWLEQNLVVVEKNFASVEKS